MANFTKRTEGDYIRRLEKAFPRGQKKREMPNGEKKEEASDLRGEKEGTVGFA